MEFALAVGGFFLAIIAQRIIVPILVSLLGERRFASPSAFDGCTLSIVAGLVSFFGGVFLRTGAKLAAKSHQTFHGSPWWFLFFMTLGITIYGVMYLWVLGSDGRNQEWEIVDGHILDKEGQELHPTFIRERSEYNQTDAFNGYSHYFLELYSDQELLATNAYNSEEKFKQDVEQVRELTNAKRLDLIWVWRAESRKWMVAEFPDEWTLILCGSLDRLTEEDRGWWQGWIYPEFASRVGAEVEPLDAIERLRRLAKAYGQEMVNRNPNIAQFANQAQRVLLSEGPVVALNKAQFKEQVNEVRGNATSILCDGDFRELTP